jgi:hypothetical protein
MEIDSEMPAASPRSIIILQKFQPVIESAAKLLLAGSALLYSLGLFISNLISSSSASLPSVGSDPSTFWSGSCGWS